MHPVRSFPGVWMAQLAGTVACRTFEQHSSILGVQDSPLAPALSSVQTIRRVFNPSGRAWNVFVLLASQAPAMAGLVANDAARR
jgi:hypothetical protein